MDDSKPVRLKSASGTLDSSVVAEGNMSGDVLSLDILRDPPPGPLDEYRKRASFDWKKMKMFYYEEDILRFQVMWKLNRELEFLLWSCITVITLVCPLNLKKLYFFHKSFNIFSMLLFSFIMFIEQNMDNIRKGSYIFQAHGNSFIKGLQRSHIFPVQTTV